MIYFRKYCTSLLLVLLSSCATLAPTPEPPFSANHFAGRLTVKVSPTPVTEARTVTAAFTLQGDAEQGHLDLSTPLGTILAQAQWQSGYVVLATSQGKKQFANFDDLTYEMLGESVPLAALFDWLHGQPWSGALSKRFLKSETEQGFHQLTWSVNLGRFNEGWIEIQREYPPIVVIKIKLDQQ